MNPTRATAYGLLALDVFVSILVFNVVVYFRGVAGGSNFLLLPLAPPIAALFLAIYLIEGYKDRTDMLSVDYTSQHVIALIGAMLATLLLTFVALRDGYELQSSRSVIFFSFLTLIPLTIGYRRLIYELQLQARGDRSLVFLGDRSSCEAFRVEAGKMGTTQPLVFSVITTESGAPIGPVGHDQLRPFQEVLDDIQGHRLAVEAVIGLHARRSRLAVRVVEHVCRGDDRRARCCEHD